MSNSNFYIHTISGRIGVYIPRQQVVFANNGTKLSDLLVDSLEKIRIQQTASRIWRKKQGFTEKLPENYGYFRVSVNWKDKISLSEILRGES